MPGDKGAVRETRLAGRLRTAEPDLADGAADEALAEVSAAPVPVPVSAMATAVPPTIAAPNPSVTAPAPSQAYGWIRPCLATD